MVIDYIEHQAVYDVIAFILGLAVGSFLNVVALRSLSGESWMWPASHCTSCRHTLSALDNIPVVSYLMLGGKCRYCGKPISWQYPVVELGTALTFVLVTHYFMGNNQIDPAIWAQAGHAIGTNSPGVHGNVPPGYCHPMFMHFHPTTFLGENSYANLGPFIRLEFVVGMLIYACTLIAISITDFREKLIPHEITYPSMILGIIFSTVVRQDFVGAMVGIGASYLIFDFLAFYGLKVYYWIHGEEVPPKPRRLLWQLPWKMRRRLPRRHRRRLAAVQTTAQQEEQMEVMGGGDAVLSAVMSAWLGWQLLAFALIVGFLIGTTQGLILLFVEMKKAKLLHKCMILAAKGALIAACIMGGFGLAIQIFLGADATSSMALSFAFLGALSGALLGVIKAGTGVSKPYPFGPALAAGGFIAMFFVPSWLFLH